MEYNKFIYKINKYKSYIRDENKKKKEHYKKKLDLYYAELEKIINTNGNNLIGGMLTNDELLKLLKPTSDEFEEQLDRKANLTVFQEEQQKYKENHEKIISSLKEILEANNDLNRLNAEADEKLDEIKEQMKLLKDTHKKEIVEKLKQIKDKVDKQKNLTLDDIKYKK